MRLSAKAPIVIRGEEITHLDADGYKHLPRATALPDGKVLATSNGAWRASDLSGVSVSSVFGRTGTVTAQTGDYTATQVGAEPYAGVPAQTSFWRSTAAGVRAWVQLVAADITDLATVLAGYLTKNNPSWTGSMDGGSGATFRMSSLQGGLGNDFVCADMIGFIRKVTPSQALTNMQGMSLALKGAANGVAELGADGRVPTSQLPASLALGETSATAYRGDRGKIAYDHSQATGNPHGTTAADVGALAKITLTGAIDSHAINGGAPGLYELRGSSYVNFPGALLAASGGTLLQTVGNNGRILQELHSELTGKMIQRQTGPSTWSGWTTIWDDDILPVSTTGLAVVSAANQAAARAAIGLSQTELLIHSDFGRAIVTGGWQSSFTDNTVSALMLPANSVANGTQIRFEQLLDNAASISGAWQLAIGPLLPAGTGPSYPAYLDVVDTDTISSAPGKLVIEVEFLGAGSNMVAHVSSRVFCDAFGGSGMQVSNGTIPFDATIDRYIDIQVQPAGMTDPVIRRNRVFRRNP